MSYQELNNHDAELQKWIDGLLVTPEASPTAPSELKKEITLNIQRSTRKKWLGNFSAAAAAIIIASFIWHKSQNTPAPTHTLTNSKKLPAVTFVGSDSMIVLKQEEVAPNVTVVQCVPTVDAEKQMYRQKLIRSIRNRIANRGDNS